VIIYPQKTPVRDTKNAFEIDDDDPHFVQDPLGLYASYFDLLRSRLLILAHSETSSHWDTVASFPVSDLGRARSIFPEIRSAKICEAKLYISASSRQLQAQIILIPRGEYTSSSVYTNGIEELFYLFKIDFWEELNSFSECQVLIQGDQIVRLGHPTKDKWISVTTNEGGT
jgi:hypothetical protein